MKKLLSLAAAGIVMMGLAAPSFADNTMPASSFELCHDMKLQGTFQGTHMGQILFRTDDGRNMELNSMAIFFGTDPWVHQADLRQGDHLSIWIPEGTTMHVLDSRTGAVAIGDYDGVAFVPQETLSMLQSDSYSVADR